MSFVDEPGWCRTFVPSQIVASQIVAYQSVASQMIASLSWRDPNQFWQCVFNFRDDLDLFLGFSGNSEGSNELGGLI